MREPGEVLGYLANMLAPDTANPDGCSCSECWKARHDLAPTFICPLCGFHGLPASERCHCPTESHPHPHAAARAFGPAYAYRGHRLVLGNGAPRWLQNVCSHGCLYCPVCRGEAERVFRIVAAIRRVISGAEEETLRALGLGPAFDK